MSEIWVEALGNDTNVNGQQPPVLNNRVAENMSAALTLRAADKGGSELECQVMLWPTTDANFATMFYEYADGYFWLGA
jgi:hypothetical protein